MGSGERPLWRLAWNYVLNLLAAVIGTTFIGFALLSWLPRSRSWQEYFLRIALSSAISGALLGAIAARFRQTMAVWIWTLPTAVFLIVFGLPNVAGAREELFASNCSAHGDVHCEPFLFVTIPAIRAISYSIAAAVVFRITQARVSEDALDPDNASGR
jgi:hypothetical protein